MLDQSLVTRIAARSKLVTLTMKSFSATKKNPQATREVNEQHGTGDAAKVSVKFCNHAALADLRKVHSDTRSAHDEMTLPTVARGMRFVPLAKELEHAAKLADFRRQHDTLVAQFLADYDSEKAKAPLRLNGLFDERCWPEREKVADCFGFQLQYLPCPTEGEWADWITASAAVAQQELTEQLETAIKRVAERCASDGKLYDTVFSNLRDILALAPDLNLAADPRIAAIIAQAKAIGDNDADTCRRYPHKRRQAAEQADKLAQMFGGMAFQSAA